MIAFRRLALLVLGSSMASCIPVEPTGPNWGLPFGSATGVNSTGSSPGVLVVGDSLIQNAGAQTLADMIRFWRGTDSVVVAAGGASFAHFNSPTLIHPVGLSTISEYVSFFGDVRVTVLALGSNDARIMQAEAGSQYGYNFQEFGQQLSKAITDARAHSRCVLVVGMARWPDAVSAQLLSDVNSLMAWAASTDWRIEFADWQAYSASHPDWFVSPGNVHHTETGKAAYRDYINNWLDSMLNNGC